MMNDIFDNLTSTMNATANACNGIGQMAQVTQQAVMNLQDISRRNFGWNNNAPQQTNMYPAGEPPVTFTPYQGFWNENYGR